jgi:hypothetical protein
MDRLRALDRVRYNPRFVTRRSVCMLPKRATACNRFFSESTRASQENSVTHSLSTARAASRGAAPLVYGRIVVIGVGDAETIGDAEGIGWALVASVVAPATQAPRRTIAANHRFMTNLSSFAGTNGRRRLVPVRSPALNQPHEKRYPKVGVEPAQRARAALVDAYQSGGRGY